MYVVDSTSFYFDLVTGFAIYKTYMFGENDLVFTSSTLLHFGLLKTFILAPCWIAVKYFGFFQMIDHGEQNPTDILSKCETFLQMFPAIKSPLLCCQQYGNDIAIMSPSLRPRLACEVSWCVPVHGKGELHRYKSHCG